MFRVVAPPSCCMYACSPSRQKLAQLQDEVARLEAQVEEYKAAAEAMEKRVELEWKVEILKKKILWVRVLAKRKEAEGLRAERDAAKEAMKVLAGWWWQACSAVSLPSFPTCVQAALAAHAPLKQLVASTNAAKVELQAVCKKADTKRMRMTTKTGQYVEQRYWAVGWRGLDVVPSQVYHGC